MRELAKRTQGPYGSGPDKIRHLYPNITVVMQLLISKIVVIMAYFLFLKSVVLISAYGCLESSGVCLQQVVPFSNIGTNRRLLLSQWYNSERTHCHSSAISTSFIHGLIANIRFPKPLSVETFSADMQASR